MNTTSGYYISTGARNCFFTLRHWFDEQAKVRSEDGNGEIYTIRRDYHIQNLSIDKQEAIAKAKELTGLDLSASFDVKPIGERNDIDWSILQSGKYQGQSIHEIRESDPNYLVWLCENMANSKAYEKTVELAKALVARELETSASSKQAKQDAIQQRENAIKADFAQEAEYLTSCGNFGTSIAETLRSGSLPYGRGLDITVDILSKRAGRGNSKAYWAEFEVVSTKFQDLKYNEKEVTVRTRQGGGF